MCGVQYILWTKERNEKSLGKLLDRFIRSQFVPLKYLGKPQPTKTDEFSEKFQTAF